MSKTTIEDAVKAIIDNQHLKPEYLEKLVAIRDGNLPGYYQAELIRKRAYSNDVLPGRLAGDWHPNYPHMKCRRSVIFGIGIDLQAMVEEEIITDDSLKEKIRQFVSRQWESQRGGKGKFWTTPEEILLINSMLDHAISYLQRTYGLESK